MNAASLSAVLSFALASAVASLPENAPVVRTEGGLVSGQTITVSGRPVDAFYGVPYAEPPVDDLRFRKPVPARPWNGTFRATPTKPCKDTVSCTANLPVIVFIHGGAFQWGDSAIFLHDGANMVAHSDVVFVSFNYRLNVFGFLSSDTDELAGNWGIWDQNLLLKWVQRNIGFFGGDPKQRPRGVDIVMSLARHVNCVGWRPRELSEVMDCLRRVDKEDFLRLLNGVDPRKTIYAPVSGDPYVPNDCSYLSTWRNKIRSTEVMIGTMKDEGSLFMDIAFRLAPFVRSYLDIDHRTTATAIISALLKIPGGSAKEVTEAYFPNDHPGDKESILSTLQDAAGEGLFVCASNFFAEIASEQGLPTYRYVFAHRPSYSLWPRWYGATHGDDIPFVLGSLSFYGDESRYTEAVLPDRALYDAVKHTDPGGAPHDRHDCRHHGLRQDREANGAPVERQLAALHIGQSRVPVQPEKTLIHKHNGVSAAGCFQSVLLVVCVITASLVNRL
ncbi:hypothetical protein MRX96_002559 [Rhipicephalus microplus]